MNRTHHPDFKMVIFCHIHFISVLKETCTYLIEASFVIPPSPHSHFPLSVVLIYAFMLMWYPYYVLRNMHKWCTLYLGMNPPIQRQMWLGCREKGTKLQTGSLVGKQLSSPRIVQWSG